MQDVPLLFVCPAVFVDGLTQIRHEVLLRLTCKSLHIVQSGRDVAIWPLPDIRCLDSLPTTLRLRSVHAHALARLEITDIAMQEALQRHYPQALSHLQDASAANYPGFGRMILACGLFLVVSIYAILYVSGWLVPFVPAYVEKGIGDAASKQLITQFGGKICTAEAGSKALARLSAALAQGRLAGMPKILVVDTPDANAFALPGGTIIVLRGLLDKAAAPDELAGVLAHEMGHEYHHDGLRKMLQAGGLSFVFSILSHGAMGSAAVAHMTQSLTQASYSRQAETLADDFAIETLHGLGRPVEPMGQLLERIAEGREKEWTNILSSHPLTRERMGHMHDAGASETGHKPPLLEFGDWRAIKQICLSQ